MHWHAIANELHYSSPGHAHQRFMAVLAAYPREDIDTCRDILNDRYEAMIHVLWPKVLCGNLSAIDRATRLCEAQAKLLGANRTERPERPELSASAADLDAALRALEGELRARAGGEPIPDE
ncbi:MAG: hypothetical protein DLM61_09515 [Pseudonocardiales bacterium]|nr:MAG: hypothetical protein DLM61_09515 [Pseudonocardiales bacterium]